MSKLDGLVNKIADVLLPKMRRMVREELDYKLDGMSSSGQSKSQSPITGGGDDSPPSNKHRDFTKVAESFKMDNAMMEGSEGVIYDDNGRAIDTKEIVKSDPKAKNLIDKIGNADYSCLID